MEPYSSPKKKEIQDSLGFWIPRLEFEVLDSKSLSGELGFLISFVSGIPDSKFPRFRNPNYMGRISQYTKEHIHIYTTNNNNNISFICMTIIMYDHIHFPLGTIVSDRSSRPRFLADVLSLLSEFFRTSCKEMSQNSPVKMKDI